MSPDRGPAPFTLDWQDPERGWGGRDAPRRVMRDKTGTGRRDAATNHTPSRHQGSPVQPSRADLRLVTIAEAAQYARCDYKSIQRRLDRELTAYRLGRAVRVDLNELERLMAGGRAHDAA